MSQQQFRVDQNSNEEEDEISKPIFTQHQRMQGKQQDEEENQEYISMNTNDIIKNYTTFSTLNLFLMYDQTISSIDHNLEYISQGEEESQTYVQHTVKQKQKKNGTFMEKLYLQQEIEQEVLEQNFQLNSNEQIIRQFKQKKMIHIGREKSTNNRTLILKITKSQEEQQQFLKEWKNSTDPSKPKLLSEPKTFESSNLGQNNSNIKEWILQFEQMISLAQIVELMNGEDKDQKLKTKLNQFYDEHINVKISSSDLWYTKEGRFALTDFFEDKVDSSRNFINNLYNTDFNPSQLNILDFDFIWTYFYKDKIYKNKFYFLHYLENSQNELIYKAGGGFYRITLVEKQIPETLNIISNNDVMKSVVGIYEDQDHDKVITKAFQATKGSNQFQSIIKQLIIGNICETERLGPKFKQHQSNLRLYFCTNKQTKNKLHFDHQKIIYYFEMNPYLEINTILKKMSLGEFLSQLFPRAVKLIKKLKILHSKKIIHGDIKPQNILYMNDHFQKEFCFNDFQTSEFLNESIEMSVKTHYFGTLKYMSPEMKKIYENKQPGWINLYANDIYSLIKSLEVLMNDRLKQIEESQRQMNLQYYQQLFSILKLNELERIKAFELYVEKQN